MTFRQMCVNTLLIGCRTDLPRGLESTSTLDLIRHPEVPEGDWYKNFGSFKICGRGPYPKTFFRAARQPRARVSDWLPLDK